MLFVSTKKLLHGLALILGLSLPLHAVTTEELKKFFAVSTKTETALYLATAAGVTVAKCCEKGANAGATEAYLKDHSNAVMQVITLVSKPSDIVGSALELPKSWPKMISQELAVAIAQVGTVESPGVRLPDELVVLDAIGRVIDTAIFNKVNELVNKHLPEADQQVKRRIMRVVLMIAPRYALQLVGMLILDWMVGMQVPQINTGDLASWAIFNQRVLQSSVGQMTIEHIIIECAGAVLAELIDNGAQQNLNV